MSLTFDTGLTRSTRELIVGALAAALADLRRPPNGARYLAGIVSLPEMASGKESEESPFLSDFAGAAGGRVPCIGIATGDAKSEAESEDALELRDTIEIGIYVMSGNQRGLVDGRLFVDVGAAADDTKDPGVFAILQHVAERIQGADLGIPGVGVPFKTGEALIMTFSNGTLWGQTYQLAVHFEINPNRNATTVMTSIEAKHRGDGIPDATSLDPLIDSITTLDP